MPAGSCSGWGGSHYITFDGTPYSFWDNCTYVLVREIHPRHGGLTVLLHNHYCGAAPGPTRCPRALSIRYGSTEVVLTTTTTAGGQEESLVSVGTADGDPGPEPVSCRARAPAPSDGPPRIPRSCSMACG